MTTYKQQLFFNFITFISLVGFFQAASAATLTLQDGTTNVGDVDYVIASTKLDNSSLETELNWIQDELGQEMIISGKVEEEGMIWLDVYDYNVKSEDIFAMAIDEEVDYFLIKVGNGSALDGTPTHFLFDNNEVSSWAVISLALMGFDTTKIEISKVSHVTNTISPVPLPAAVFLFGSALLGMVGFCHLKGKKSKLRS